MTIHMQSSKEVLRTEFVVDRGLLRGGGAGRDDKRGGASFPDETNIRNGAIDLPASCVGSRDPQQ